MFTIPQCPEGRGYLSELPDRTNLSPCKPSLIRGPLLLVGNAAALDVFKFLLQPLTPPRAIVTMAAVSQPPLISALAIPHSSEGHCYLRLNPLLERISITCNPSLLRGPLLPRAAISEETWYDRLQSLTPPRAIVTRSTCSPVTRDLPVDVFERSDARAAKHPWLGYPPYRRRWKSRFYRLFYASSAPGVLGTPGALAQLRQPDSVKR